MHRPFVLLLLVGLVASLSVGPAASASNEFPIEVDWPQAGPGMTVTLTGTFAAACSAERTVGWGVASMEADEAVVPTTSVSVGASFSVEIELPDPLPDDPVLYARCVDPSCGPGGCASSATYPIQVFEVPDLGDPGGDLPTAPPGDAPVPFGGGVPLSRPDELTTGAGERLMLPAPGILGNDEDPDGDVLAAVLQRAFTTIDARLRVRPDGSVVLTPSGDAGIVCIEYVARDPGRLVSEPTTVLIVVGDAPAPDVTEGCPSPDGTGNEYEFDLLEVAADEELELEAAGPGGVLLAMPADLQASDALLAAGGPWRTWGADRKYFRCNSTPVQRGLSAFYGSMTAYVGVARGTADYVRIRPRYIQSNTVVHVGGWTNFRGNVVYGKIHQRFGAPGELYVVSWQVEWMEDRWFRRDVAVARSRWVNYPVGCWSAYS